MLSPECATGFAIGVRAIARWMPLQPSQGLILATLVLANRAHHISEIQLLHPAGRKERTQITQAVLVAGHHHQP